MKKALTLSGTHNILGIMDNIKQTELFRALLSQGELDELDIIEWIKEARKEVEDGENPEEILYDMGLEPDYIFDLL